MIRSNLPIGLGILKKWKEDKKCLRDDLPFQRHTGMWSNIIQSSLVWALLADSYVPPIVLLKDKDGVDAKGKDVFVYQILDGLQRLTTLFGFINNEFKMHSSTPSVELDGKTEVLEGKTFSELSDEAQDVLTGYRFTVECLENYTYEEAESLFFNINSGVALSTIQKSKAKMGTELISFLNGLLRGNFFTQGINITVAQARREDDLCLLLQTMLLLDNMKEGLEYKNISTATCLSYAETIRGKYGRDKQESLTELIKYADEAFSEKNKFLRKNNVPIVLVCAKIAQGQGVDASAFKSFINDFASGVYPAYEEASGSGNVKALKVQMRLRVMFIAMCEYFSAKTDEIVRPFSQSIELYEGEGVVADVVAEVVAETVVEAEEVVEEAPSVTEEVIEDSVAEQFVGEEPAVAEAVTELPAEEEPAPTETAEGVGAEQENSEAKEEPATLDEEKPVKPKNPRKKSGGLKNAG